MGPRVLLARADGGVGNLEGADVLVVVGLVGEGSIEEDCIKTDRRSVDVRGLCQLCVLILLKVR